MSDPHPISPDARCVGCGYSLYQLETDRCPECGREFDRDDPRSMGIQYSRLSEFSIKRLNRRTSRITRAVPWAATSLLAYGTAFLWQYPFAIAFGITLWTLFLIGHVPLMIARQIFAQRIEPKILQSDKRMAWITACAVTLSVVACYVPIFAFVYFLIFHGQFDRLADRVPLPPVNYADFPDSQIGPCVLSVSRFPGFVCLSGSPPYQNYYRPVGARPGIQFIRVDVGQAPPSDATLWNLGKNWYVTGPQWPEFSDEFWGSVNR